MWLPSLLAFVCAASLALYSIIPYFVYLVSLTYKRLRESPMHADFCDINEFSCLVMRSSPTLVSGTKEKYPSPVSRKAAVTAMSIHQRPVRRSIFIVA